MFTFLATRGGMLLLGYFMQISEFSLYAIGSMWVMTARGVLQQLVRKVGYPIFSEIGRERPHDRTRLYYRVRTALDAASIFAFLAAYFLAEPFFDALYPERYAGVAGYVRLSAVSLLLAPYQLLSTVLLTTGDSRKYTLITVFPGLALLGGLPLTYYSLGSEAAVLFVALLQVFAIPFIWRASRTVVQLRPWREAFALVLAVASAFVVNK
jgi:O-antigen/teichoic acid export membrane protein